MFLVQLGPKEADKGVSAVEAVRAPGREIGKEG
jgi:hypothetical protein